jgi:hypothetical protein
VESGKRQRQPAQGIPQGVTKLFRRQGQQALAQPHGNGDQLADVGCAGALRAVAQAHIGLLFGAHLQGIDEHPWVGDHAVAPGPSGALVVLEPGRKLAR